MASVVIAGDTSGSVSVTVPATAGSNTITLPAVTGTAVISGQNSAITADTAKAWNWNGSTTNTSIDFTSIPSWVKRITVMFDGVSTNGTSNMVVRIGSGSVSTSGYTTATPIFGGANNTAVFTYTDGWNLTAPAAAGVMRGTLTLNLLNSATNAWAGAGIIFNSGAPYGMFPTGNISLAGALDRVRITMVNGTDTFDAGTINILYE